MIIQITNENGCTTVALEGRLDTTTSPKLEEELDQVLDGVTDLVFDFKELEYLSSAGLRIVMGTEARVCEENGGQMKIIHVNEEIAEIFEMTGLCEILTIE